MKRALFVLAIAAGLVGVGMVIATTYLTSSVQAEVKTVNVPFDTTPEKIEGLKKDVVARLMQCESAGYSEDDGIIIFDTNGKASIGPAQFQKKTVIHYVKQLYGREISAKEAVLLALDANEAAQLAQDIIFTTSNGVEKDWYNCSKKLGLQAEVNIIKKLDK